MKPGFTRTRRAGHDTGYSLPELLIVIALIGLFVVFGGPSLADAFRAYKVRSVANDVVTDLRALRYNAVSTRTPRTMTLNNTTSASPNQYAYTNFKGNPITVLIEPGVAIETTSAASITFNINGSTGATGNQTVSLSMFISGSRNDRYTITITPSGTISSAYSTF
jgi:prepilin-type N-terminal cleavage/methylation domain-containing protein